MLVGIVSNGLACVMLVYFGFQGTWSTWSNVAAYCMWGSAIFTGLITVLFVISILRFGGRQNV